MKSNSKHRDSLKINKNIINGTYGKGIEVYKSADITENKINLTKGNSCITVKPNIEDDSYRCINIHNNELCINTFTLDTKYDSLLDEESYTINDGFAIFVDHSGDDVNILNNNIQVETDNKIFGGIKCFNSQKKSSKKVIIDRNNIVINKGLESLVDTGIFITKIKSINIINNKISKLNYGINLSASIEEAKINNNEIYYTSRAIDNLSCPKLSINMNTLIGDSHCINTKIGATELTQNKFVGIDKYKTFVWCNDLDNLLLVNNIVENGYLAKISNKNNKITNIDSISNTIKNTYKVYIDDVDNSIVFSKDNNIRNMENTCTVSNLTSINDYGLNK